MMDVSHQAMARGHTRDPVCHLWMVLGSGHYPEIPGSYGQV